MSYESNIVIIADDDIDDSLFLLQALISLPLELIVIAVPNGQKLIDVFETVSPKYIFLDINMPKKNGFDALKHIRSHKRLPKPRVIMCSTSSSHAEIELSHELGADMYVTKPNNINNLNKMVEDIFNRDWPEATKGRSPKAVSSPEVVEYM